MAKEKPPVLSYQRPKPAVTIDMKQFPKEYKIPSILIAIGGAIFLAAGAWAKGAEGVVAMMIGVPLLIGLTQGPGVVAGFFAGRFLGAGYGLFSSMILKLLAIVLFSYAVTFYIPWVGWAVRMALWMGMLMWLFDMEAFEAFIFTLVAYIVNFAWTFLIGPAVVLSLLSR